MALPALSPELIRRLDVPGPRYTSYPTVPDWSDGFGPADYGAALDEAGRHPERPLSLYVHLPFCREMCTYCGCNVIVTRDPKRADAYLDSLEAEIALTADRLGARRQLSRLHLGGGTPTFLSEAQLARLWRALTAHFTLLPGAEIALEIDPVVTTPGQLALLASLGFRRLSMGVQDFDERVQQAVNRIQSVASTRAILDEARRLGFRSVNFDLIYGLPLQTLDSWRRTIEQVAELRPDRVAAFSFAFVPDARPHQRRLARAGLPMLTGPDKFELLRATEEILGAHGYRAIGMDHFALPEEDLSRAVSQGALWRDFQGYTTERAPDTVALGVTAISDVGGAYAQNVLSLSAYDAAVRAGRFATVRGLRLDDDDRLRRGIITDLMCNSTVDLAAWLARAGFGGQDPARFFAPDLAALAPLVSDGMAIVAGARVTLTDLGRAFVRNAAMCFDTRLRRRPAGARPTFSRTV